MNTRVQMDILFRDHDALRAQLNAAQRICVLFESPEQMTHEIQRAWPEIRVVLREFHSFFAVELPHHHLKEEQCLYPRLLAKLSAPEKLLVEEITSEHPGIEVLSGVLLELIGPWLRTSIPPRLSELPRFTGLICELNLHLERHMSIEDEKILPLAATVLTASERRQVTVDIANLRPHKKQAAK